MEQFESKKMGEMPVTRLVFNMSIPVIISMLVQALYNVVDSAFVGQYNSDALEALSLAFPIQNLMISLAVGISVGVNALVSRHLGEQRRDRASDVANTGFLLSGIAYAGFAILAIFIIKPFFAFQTGIPVVEEYGYDYLSIVMFFGFGIFAEIMAERLLQSTGRTKLSMLSQITGAVINIILDPILIFGYCGAPAMGVKGAAIATVIGQIAAGIFAIILNVVFNKELQLSIKKVFTPIGRDIAEIFKIGIPSMLLNALMSLVVFGVNAILRNFSEDAITAYGIYFKLISFIYLPIFGLNNGLVPILGYNYGSGRIDRVKKAYKVGQISTFIYMAAGFAIFEIFGYQLLSIFNATDSVAAIGIVLLHIFALGFIPSGIDIINSTFFQAVGNPIHSLIVSLLRNLLIFLPLFALFAFIGGLTFAWWSLPIAEVLSLAISMIFYKKTIKKLENSERVNVQPEI